MHIMINSALIPSNDASVSISERGFKFGDGVFETIAVHDRQMRQFNFHMERLKAGLSSIRIPCSLELLESDCTKLLDANQIREGLLRIYVSRGQGGRGYAPDPTMPALVVIEAMPYAFQLESPVSLWLSTYEKISPKALPVQSKIAQGMQSTLAMLEAQDQGCKDALMLNADGHVTESTSGNIFWLQNNELHTPALECGVLNGSTRHAIVNSGLWPVKEGHYNLDDLTQAEAVILTNCRVKALPVNRLMPADMGWESKRFAKKCYDFLMHEAKNSG